MTAEFVLLTFFAANCSSWLYLAHTNTHATQARTLTLVHTGQAQG